MSSAAAAFGFYPALVMAFLALVECLHNRGVLDASEYRQRLIQLWNQMGKEDSEGSAGDTFGRLIDVLDDIIGDMTEDPAA